MSVEVLAAGTLTSVQDTVGRSGWRHLGVPEGGAADGWSARLANRLVGNPDEAAVLEVTLSGPTLRFDEAVHVALVGRFSATLDGLPLPPAYARRTRPGSVLRVGSGEDARGYLAIAGGVAVEPVLGSSSTDVRSGFGGHEGRALRIGDRLGIGSLGQPRAYRWTGRASEGRIRIVPGPHGSEHVLARLVAEAWRIGAEADRTGARLDGEQVPLAASGVPSMGLPLGAIQVPPDGRPIVMLADRPVTGGYPVPAVVIRADIGRVARMRPGTELRFASVSVDEAREQLSRAMEELAALEAVGAWEDDELGWAGSHR